MDAPHKRPYQKPTIERIILLGEEMTIAGCKQDTGGGKGQMVPNPCDLGTKPKNCKTVFGS